MAFPLTDDEDPPAVSRWPHILRLAVFAAFLLTLFYLVAVRRVIVIEAVRATIAQAGPLAPLVYIPVSALLATMFVPGPLLAAGSGVLFGPVLGTFVTLGSTVRLGMGTGGGRCPSRRRTAPPGGRGGGGSCRRPARAQRPAAAPARPAPQRTRR